MPAVAAVIPTASDDEPDEKVEVRSVLDSYPPFTALTPKPKKPAPAPKAAPAPAPEQPYQYPQMPFDFSGMPTWQPESMPEAPAPAPDPTPEAPEKPPVIVVKIPDDIKEQYMLKAEDYE
jgi:hypothetical protein